MPTEYIQFQQCRDAEGLQEIQRVLTDAGIPHQLASTARDSSAAWTGFGGVGPAGSDAQVIVTVPEGRFQAAHDAMEQEYLAFDLPDDHYLHNLSDEDLAGIVAESSTWSPFDVAQARRLVKERNIDLDKIAEKKADFLVRLKSGRPASSMMLITGWVFTLLGGVVGLGIAWSITNQKVKVPEGEFFVYNEKSRRKGQPMLIVAILVMASLLGIRLAEGLSN